MDKEIIKRFRDEVNAQDLVLQMYRNYAGKNYWNIICSAMDWIDVVVEMIDIKNVSKKNDNDSSIKVMTFIMCIDVMWEAVQQLHRIFFDKIIFSTQITNPTNLRIVNQYRTALLCKVDELFAVLQEMRLITLESTEKINDHCPTEYQYTFSKLVDAVFCSGSIQLVNINDFKVCLGHLIDFGNIESIEELYVCVKAGFFYLNSKGYP